MSPANNDIATVANTLLQDHCLKVSSVQVLQDLWAGYGKVCRIHAQSTTPPPQTRSLILKYITPPPSTSPSSSQDEGHLRKLLSYQVELYFYTHLAPQLPPHIPIASCLASARDPHADTTALLLTDLRENFPVAGEKRAPLSPPQVHAALSWLATFHAFWWPRRNHITRAASPRAPPLEERSRRTPGSGVWANGGYTYLATRRQEFSSLRGDVRSEWRTALCGPRADAEGGRCVAEDVARVLTSRAVAPFETLIHGDVKAENLFTTAEGRGVALFDFQYVGLGLGVCDLAKLFTCAVPVEMLAGGVRAGRDLDMQEGERRLLDEYRVAVETASGRAYPWEDLERHWKTALVDWLRFQASWGFWGNTRWLEARVRKILSDGEWTAWVVEASRTQS